MSWKRTSRFVVDDVVDQRHPMYCVGSNSFVITLSADVDNGSTTCGGTMLTSDALFAGELLFKKKPPSVGSGAPANGFVNAGNAAGLVGAPVVASLLRFEALLVPTPAVERLVGA